MRRERRIDTSFRQMVVQKISKFLSSGGEYLEFPECILKSEEDVIVSAATSRNLFVRQCTEYNKSKIRVYKNSGECFLESTNISISEKSAKILYNFLRKDLTIYKSRPYDVCKPSGYKFSIGFSGKTTVVPKLKPPVDGDFRANLPILDHKEDILRYLQSHNVLIILGEAGCGKSTQVPLFLLESSAAQNIPCKMLSLQNSKLATVLYSEVLAGIAGEHTVGYHIHLEGRSSALTCLMFTTYTFFLRWLVSLENYEVFKSITHVIIDDVHQGKAILNLILKEMRNVMASFSNVKLILLGCPMDATPFTRYFPGAAVINVDCHWQKPQLLFLEDVLCFIGDRKSKVNAMPPFSDEARNFADQLVEKCYTTGDFDSFSFLLYAIEYENVPVDVRHTTLKITPLIAAAYHNNVEVLAKLLKLKANIFLTDKDNRSALSWAVEMKSSKCLELLEESATKIVKFKAQHPEKFELLSAYEASRMGSKAFDHDLLSNVVLYVHNNFEVGTIVVFMPDFGSILQQKELIMKKLQNVVVLELHDDTNCSDIRWINQHYSENIRKIVLATDIAETTVNIRNAVCVIDTGKKSNMSYSLEADNFGYGIRCITKEESFRRSLIAGRLNCSKNTLCIRLYSSFDYEEFDDAAVPEIKCIPLEKFCLFATLLTRGGNLFSYLESVFERISSRVVEKCVRTLKTIGAIDRLNCVTPLGVRLVDIPVDIHLGKALVYAVILRCLDPVVTIVSGLAYRDPWKDPLNYCHERKMKESRVKFSEGLYSDHLGLLRVFQRWQNEKSINSGGKFCEENFLLDSTLQTITNIRVMLIGSLRVSNLIHSNGMFCMKTINENSDNWPLVKCALAAGSYPHICYIDKTNNFLRRAHGRRLILGRSSVLRPINRGFLERVDEQFPSNWVFSYGAQKHGHACSISYNSILSPVGLMLFTGNSEMSRKEQVLIKGEESQFFWTETSSFIMSKRDALLLAEIRYRLSKFVMFALDCCNDQEGFGRKKQMFGKVNLVSVLASIVEYEEFALNLRMPHKVGEKPKALPGKNISEHHRQEQNSEDTINSNCQSKCCYILSKVFYNNISVEMTWPLSSLQLIKDYVGAGYNVTVFGHCGGVLSTIGKFGRDRPEAFQKLLDVNIPLSDLRSAYPGGEINDNSDWQWLSENCASKVLNGNVTIHPANNRTSMN